MVDWDGDGDLSRQGTLSRSQDNRQIQARSSHRDERRYAMKEYRVLGLRAAADMEREMNELAAERWEFVGATESADRMAVVIMERPKKAEPFAVSG